MTFSEDMKRASESYLAFPPEVSAAKAKCVLENPGCTEHHFIGMNEEGHRTLWVRVVSAEGDVVGEFNTTFQCPPFCQAKRKK